MQFSFLVSGVLFVALSGCGKAPEPLIQQAARATPDLGNGIEQSDTNAAVASPANPTPFPLPSEAPGTSIAGQQRAALKDLKGVATPDVNTDNLDSQLQQIEQYNRALVPRIEAYRQTLPNPTPEGE